MIKIERADKSQAREIARLIMLAMNYECCLFFVGEGQTLSDFEEAMVRLVERDDSQYSYRNTLVAVDYSENNSVVGICVSYDGSKLHELRRAFINEAQRSFGRDFSNIADETEAGELYVDSLAVADDYRHKGIATALLKATIEKAHEMGIPRVGLLVDKGNPEAERLYNAVGFRFMNENQWGGHPMKHFFILS